MRDEPISPLRRRMIEDMTIRNFSADTQRNYIRAVKNLASFLGRSPDTLARALGDHAAGFTARRALWNCYLNRGELARSLALADGLLAEAEASNDVDELALGCRAVGATRCFVGNPLSAVEVLRRGAGLPHRRPAEDVLRIYGEERCLRRGLREAGERGMRLLELRAATSLARLWAEHGERRRAHDLLAPVYRWFTDGFDNTDLKEAGALLDDLA